VAPYEADA
jgi:exonuclease-1